MSPAAPPLPITVRGGAGGIVADCAAMVSTARRFGAVATDTARSALTLHGYLAHPAVAVSSVFDPAGFAVFEGDLLLALDGPNGLTGAAVRAGAVDLELRAAAAAYEAADTLATPLHDAISGAAGLPGALAAGTQELRRTGDPTAAAQAALVRDPALADTVVDALGIPVLIAAAARALPDGRGVVCAPGLDESGPAGAAPRTLTDVLGDLARREDDPRHGEIDVRILTLADGRRRVIVDITGTKTWSPLPTPDITSLTTNGRALLGEATAYEQGVLAAMHRAGVRRTDQVMMVGHSEGGMVALTAARDARRDGRFDVTHVLTVGSPIGLSAATVPRAVQVLSLENSADVVPHLDGRPNPDRPNITTVTGRAGDGSIVGDHDVDRGYLPIAAAAQDTRNESVRHYVQTADPYLSAVSVETHTYQIQRR